jgi:8-oxo-dGTP pyrophosphatase MutT (NUDIX family)
MKITAFSEFLTESSAGRDTAGVAILYNRKILLVHPANGSWVRPIMGIPKGRIEPGEDVLEAALRELKEETGIELSTDQLDLVPNKVEVFNKSGKYQNSIYYFVCQIADLAEIGLDSISVPKSNLQREEIDWAGFIDINEAYHKVARAQLIILDRLS